MHHPTSRQNLEMPPINVKRIRRANFSRPSYACVLLLKPFWLYGLFSALGVGRFRRSGASLGAGWLTVMWSVAWISEPSFTVTSCSPRSLIGLGRSIFLRSTSWPASLSLVAMSRLVTAPKLFSWPSPDSRMKTSLSLPSLPASSCASFSSAASRSARLRLEFLHLALGGEGGGSGKILRDQKIAGVAGLDRDDVGFAAQAFDFGFEDDFDGHKI